MGIAGPVTDRVWALANYSASYAYPPLVSLSRAAVQSLFQQIRVGQLKIIDQDGTVTICGQQKLRPDSQADRSVYSLPVTELNVHKDLFWVRLLLFADMVRVVYKKGKARTHTSTGFRGELHAGRGIMHRSHVFLQALHSQS